MEKGLIFDIQGYSVHDGPGCRTLVFLSGCPLHCSWCSNPEGKSLRRVMMFRKSKCVPKNLHCLRSCPNSAVTAGGDGFPVFDRSICDRCESFECADGCMKEAVRIAGKEMDLDELMRILRRDQGYWGEDGGVTFTGGEPLLQKDFLLAALKECRRNYIHTAVETCACVPQDTFIRAAELADFMFVDLKHMDPEAHARETGKGNGMILKNIEAAVEIKREGELVIRLPVIPGFNDGEDNIRATAEFMRKNGLSEINILSFHRMGASKYGQMGQVYKFEGLEPPSDYAMKKIAGIFSACGINCHIDSFTPF